MPAAKRKIRPILKGLAILVVLALLVPPLQVLLTSFWNPLHSPMQFQRRVESWFSKEPFQEYPIRWVKLRDIPVSQIHFIWASEDQAFFQHRGFDLPQLNKALEEAQESGKSVRGASTITNQCARSVYLWQGRSYVRKALEYYYTFWMELLMSKQRILELYLNHIEFGSGIYGIGAAAQAYFQKTPDQLTRRQMMALAAILPNPREWSPVKPNSTVERKIRRVERLSSRAPFPVKELGAK